MMPALEDQERIFINKFVYRFGIGDILRGDMVVFWFPGDPTKSYIKRVIGIPGDTVEIDNGTVIVNGQRLEENYVLNEYRDRQPMAPFKVQHDEYFVMGDHRSSSNDSRSWGPCRRSTSTGKPSLSTGRSRRWASSSRASLIRYRRCRNHITNVSTTLRTMLVTIGK